MELARDDRRPAPRALLVAAAIGALATVLALVVVDRPLARALGPYEPLAIWNLGIEILEWVTAFPLWRMGLPVVLVAGMVVTVAVPRWRHHAYAWMYLAGLHLATRLATIHLKDATQRMRPFKWLDKGQPDATFFEGGASFPSGHGTLFTSLAIGIAVLFPRTRIPMFAIAGFVAIARVGVNEHWASDVLASFTLVTLVAWLMGWLVRPLRAAPR